jgi:hypothetical protein
MEWLTRVHVSMRPTMSVVLTPSVRLIYVTAARQQSIDSLSKGCGCCGIQSTWPNMTCGSSTISQSEPSAYQPGVLEAHTQGV